MGTAALVQGRRDTREEIVLFDFTSEEFTQDDLALWREASDTVKSSGMSKAALELQKTQVFQRAIFFAVLNLQENGVGYAGFNTDIGLAEYEDYTGFVIKARSQGTLSYWKLVMKELKADNTPSPINYEYSFAMTNFLDAFEEIRIPFADFKAYLFDGEVDARPVNLAMVMLFGLQAHGGHNLDYEQFGVGSLEIDQIRLY